MPHECGCGVCVCLCFVVFRGFKYVIVVMSFVVVVEYVRR